MASESENIDGTSLDYESLLAVCTKPSPVTSRKFRSIRRRKRKGFHGVAKTRDSVEPASQGTSSAPASSTPSRESKSADRPDFFAKRAKLEASATETKLLNSSFDADVQGPITKSRSVELGLTRLPNEGSVGNCILSKELLISSINAAAVCRFCRCKKAELELKLMGNDGLAEHLRLVCSNCHNSTALETSSKQSGSGGYDVNCRATLASLNLGQAGLERFCGIMDLTKPVNKSAYNKQMKKLEDVSLDVVDTIMQAAATRLKDVTEKESPSCVEFKNGTRIASVGVTVDGTWQKRGFSSKNGVVFVLSVRTGEVLDFEVLSKVCYECRAKQHLDKASETYKIWMDSHKDVCSINHHGSSGDMESKGACKIFLRSLESRGLKYTTLVGDGVIPSWEDA